MIIGEVGHVSEDKLFGTIHTLTQQCGVTIKRNLEKETDRDPDYAVGISSYGHYFDIGTGWIRPNSKGEMTTYLWLQAPFGHQVLHAHLEPMPDRPECYYVVWPVS